MRAALHDSRRYTLQLPCSSSAPSQSVGGGSILSVKRRIFYVGSARGSSRKTISRSLPFRAQPRDMTRVRGL